jgi:uncharacterized YigZ family protein
MNDEFQTILTESQGQYKEKGSKFNAFAYPVQSEEDIKQILQDLRKEYYDARHHCYAYRLGSEKEVYRTNDDGEPSGSAGKPIFGQLLSYDLTDILVVVIRYFGGTKLGVSGLINAYRTATRDALENSNIITKTVQHIFSIHFEYLLMNDVMKIIKDMNPDVLDQDFDLDCKMKLSIRQTMAEELSAKLHNISGLKILNPDQ